MRPLAVVFVFVTHAFAQSGEAPSLEATQAQIRQQLVKPTADTVGPQMGERRSGAGFGDLVAVVADPDGRIAARNESSSGLLRLLRGAFEAAKSNKQDPALFEGLWVQTAEADTRLSAIDHGWVADSAGGIRVYNSQVAFKRQKTAPVLTSEAVNIAEFTGPRRRGTPPDQAIYHQDGATAQFEATMMLSTRTFACRLTDKAHMLCKATVSDPNLITKYLPGDIYMAFQRSD